MQPLLEGDGLTWDVIAAQSESGKWSDETYSAALACPIHSEVRLDDLSPSMFSFNSPYGACEPCHGLGTTQEFDPELIIPDPNLSLHEGAVAAWRHQGKRLTAIYSQMIQEFCNHFNVDRDFATEGDFPRCTRNHT